MKTLKVAAIALFTMIAFSCKDDDDVNSAQLTSEEQAELVASSLGDSGFSGSAEQSAGLAESSGSSGGRTAECGFTSSGTFDFGGTLGQITFDIFYDYTIALICDSNEEPETFNASFTYSGEYDGPRIYTNHTGSGSLTITSLNEGSEYNVAGSYDRAGSFESKVRNQISGSSQIELQASQIKVNKSSKMITSGAASVTASGSIQGRGNYSFSAAVVFVGDGLATLQVSGDTYTVDLESGAVIDVD